MGSYNRFHKNVFKWYEILLNQHFGHEWKVKRVKNQLEINLKNYEGKITTEIFFNQFDNINSKISFSYWDLKKENFSSPKFKNIPAPGLELNSQSKLIYIKNKHIHMNYDFLGLIYWNLNRIEEVNFQKLDRHNRFNGIYSHAYKFNYLSRPIVDEWFNLFSQLIIILWPKINLKKNLFKIILSHDVDRPTRYGFTNFENFSRRFLGDIKRGYFLSAITSPIVRFKTKNNLHKFDRYNTFEWIMNFSEKCEIKSCFYFLCENTHPLNADYDINHPAIKNLLKNIYCRGHEIGLHPSYYSYQNKKQILGEFNKLTKLCNQIGIDQKKWGSRMHYLRWSHPNSLNICESIGINYESTLGYPDIIGFRCGTSYEYQGFDIEKNEILKIRIRPLIAMDTTFLNNGYKNIKKTLLIEKLLDLRNNCEVFGGNWSILWHNSNLTNNLELYKKTILKN